MMKFYLILAAVAVIGIGAVGYSVGSGGSATSQPVAIEGIEDMERLVELAQGETKGDPDAPVTIVEFGDYQCPGCGGWAMTTKPQIELAYVESGKAKFVFYDFPLTDIHPNAFLAARAARCASDQDKFWEYHDNLFRNQPRWAVQSDPVRMFVGYAESLGLDEGTFESCLRSEQHAELVTANMQLGRQLGVSGTPTVIVNGGGAVRRVGNDFQSIQLVVDPIIAGQGEGTN